MKLMPTLTVVLINIGLVCAAIRPLSCAESDSIAALRQARLKAAEDMWKCVQVNMGGEDHPIGEFFAAAQTLKDARLEMATTNDERIRALTEFRNELQREYTQIHNLYIANAKGGEAMTEAKWRFELLGATIRLREAEERAK